MKNWRFLTNIYISLYFKNCARYVHSYNGRRLGTRTRSMEWCHLQYLESPLFQGHDILNVKNLKMVHDISVVTMED